MDTPEAQKIVEVLEMLLDCAVKMTASDAPKKGYLTGFLSICNDDDGNPVAAIAADARAGAFMGGKLMMMPDGPLEDAAKSGKLDETLIEALSEVFNNLTIPFNNVQGNPHVASKPAAATKAQLKGASWLMKPSGILELSGEFFGSKGHLYMIVK